MKRLFAFLSVFTIAFSLTACGNSTQTQTTETTDGTTAVTESVTIVYTNDVHSYLANTVEDEDAEEVPGLRLSKVSQMVKDMRSEDKNVLLVDAGDEIQGNVYGSIDEGESVIEIMNAAGYQLATFGNHEFDYGIDRLMTLVGEADYPFISCNFHSLESNEDPCEPYKIFDIGGRKIAFIGITTPETITKSTPTYFQNDAGEFIYSIDGTADAKDLYDAVQNTLDEVEDQADIVIALGHLGVGEEELKNKLSSKDVIENTTGFDAFIDGHSHSVVESEEIQDKDGNTVLLTQTGAYLENVGVMEIDAAGNISTSLVSDYDGIDEAVDTLEQTLFDKVDAEYGTKIATLDTTLTVNNPDDDNKRLIRAQEMNIGDFTADAIYWYYNEYKQLDCDIALVNGGGIRASINAGDVTKNDVKAAQPYGNMMCLISATGQQIKDSLEMGVTATGDWDNEWDIPAENGGFMQVAGLKYTIDPSVTSSVTTNENGLFVSVDGDYRVKDIEVYNKKTGAYEPIDLAKEYTVGGYNYILRNSGNGLSMFADSELIVDYSDIDVDVLIDYIESFAGDGEYASINTTNCPLSTYEGYLLDYENPYGAGRITILE